MATQKSTTTNRSVKTPQSSKTSPLERWLEDYDSLMEEGEMAKFKELAKLIGLELK